MYHRFGEPAIEVACNIIADFMLINTAVFVENLMVMRYRT